MSFYFCLETLHLNGKFTIMKEMTLILLSVILLFFFFVFFAETFKFQMDTNIGIVSFSCDADGFA